MFICLLNIEGLFVLWTCKKSSKVMFCQYFNHNYFNQVKNDICWIIKVILCPCKVATKSDHGKYMNCKITDHCSPTDNCRRNVSKVDLDKHAKNLIVTWLARLLQPSRQEKCLCASPPLIMPSIFLSTNLVWPSFNL